MSVEISLDSESFWDLCHSNNLLLRKNTGTGENIAKHLKHEASESDTKVFFVSEYQLCEISMPFCGGFFPSDITAELVWNSGARINLACA